MEVVFFPPPPLPFSLFLSRLARSRVNCQGGLQLSCQQIFFLPIKLSTMPAEGLPSTLKGALSALIKEKSLTSFKIDGRGDSSVVLPRSSTGQPNDTVTRRYRLKPPSQLARDKRRADVRKRQVSGDSFPTRSFMPTPSGQLKEKFQEISPLRQTLQAYSKGTTHSTTTQHVNPASLPLRSCWWSVSVLFVTLSRHVT